MDLDVLLLRLHEVDCCEIPSLDKYGPSVTVTTLQEARAHVRACAEHTLRLQPNLNFTSAITVERIKIGYFSGYYPLNVRQRVEQLYECVHPMAGPSSEHGQRSIQLAALTFAEVCQVIDTHQGKSRLPFGSYPQPQWRGRAGLANLR